jgi:hypothetical protein
VDHSTKESDVAETARPAPLEPDGSLVRLHRREYELLCFPLLGSNRS